jgi:hypothetical protein
MILNIYFKLNIILIFSWKKNKIKNQYNEIYQINLHVSFIK